MESITNQSFPETRQLGLKKIGRIVRNQRGEDLFGGKSDCFDKLSDFPQRYQSCQDAWRGTRKWNLLEIWLPNDSPIFPPTQIHTHAHRFSFIMYNFFPRKGAKEAKERRKERKRKNGGFFSFPLSNQYQKALFLRSFIQLLSKAICPRTLRTLNTSAWENVLLFCVALSALRRELVKPVFCFRVIGIIRPPHPTFRVPIHPIPVISTRDCAHFEPFPLYSTFRYSSSCFPRWFICV